MVWAASPPDFLTFLFRGSRLSPRKLLVTSEIYDPNCTAYSWSCLCKYGNGEERRSQDKGGWMHDCMAAAHALVRFWRISANLAYKTTSLSDCFDSHVYYKPISYKMDE